MSSKRGSYQVEVDARDEEEAVAVAAEGLPRGVVLKSSEVRKLDEGGFEVTIRFGPPPRD